MVVDLGKLRGMSEEELSKEESGLREEIWKLRMQKATGQLQDPNRVTRARKDLARVLTVQRERQIAAAKESGR